MLGKLDIILRSRKHQGSQDQSLLEWQMYGMKHLYLQFYQDKSWMTFTTSMNSVYSIKDLSRKPCTYKARNVLAVNIVKFGWLEWQLHVMLERSYQYLQLLNRRNQDPLKMSKAFPLVIDRQWKVGWTFSFLMNG